MGEPLDLNFNLIYALVGFLIMLGMLGGIGINKPRGMSVKMWCVGYLAVALGFDALAVVGLSRRLYLVDLSCLSDSQQVPPQA